MTLNPGSRRGFLIGSLALLATPVIVRAEGLMKVAPTSVILPESRFDTRVLVDYSIGTDSMIMRVDRLQGKLLRPTARNLEVSIEEAKRVFGASHPIFDEQPAVGVQRYVMAHIGQPYLDAFSRPEDKAVLTKLSAVPS